MKKKKEKKVTIAKGVKISKKVAAKRKKKPGQSNLGKYVKVSKDDFAGPDGTYPINTKARGKSALKLAHNSPEAAEIKKKVRNKYPSLKKSKKRK